MSTLEDSIRYSHYNLDHGVNIILGSVTPIGATKRIVKELGIKKYEVDSSTLNETGSFTISYKSDNCNWPCHIDIHIQPLLFICGSYYKLEEWPNK